MSRNWIRVTECENIPLREGRVVRLGDQEIAVFNLGDRFLAVENRCPHRSGPLADGILSGESVVCPLHGWKIGLRKGNVERPAETPQCVRTFATRVEAGTLLLELQSDNSADSSHLPACDDGPGAGDILPDMEGIRA
jgi:nitrite reductase (NADH) small subunit